MTLLEKTVQNISPISNEIIKLAQERQDSLTKPRGSFGRLEELSIKIAGIQNRVDPQITDKAVFLFAGDHLTVHEENIASAPIDVTAQMLRNFVTTKGAGVNILADHVGARVIVTDMGIATAYPPSLDIYRKSIAKGVKNISKGPGMTREQAIKSIEAGIEVVLDQKTNGLDIIAIGEMGIGNTTPSSAIIAVITGQEVEQITGYGSGIIDEKLKRKIDVIKEALRINNPDPDDGIEILAKVGGFEIGGMAGAIIGAASINIPIMVDGFIATAAALIALKVAPMCKEYLISAHSSVEPGHIAATDFLNQQPLLDLGLRLGEGTGALLGISLAEAAVKILNNMTTFDEAKVIKAKERNTL